MLVCLALAVCGCGSQQQKEEPASSAADIQNESQAANANGYTERIDRENGEYDICQYDGQGYLIRLSSYTTDETLVKDIVYEPGEARRELETYALSYEQSYGHKFEQWTTFSYTPGSPLVTVQWKEVQYIETKDGSSLPPGVYTGTALVEYKMQDPNNRVTYSTSLSTFDKEQFLIVPKQYRITESNKNGVVVSEEYKFDEQKSAGNKDAQKQDENRNVLSGTVSTISYEEAVELQGYPDYNEPDTGQTWVVVKLDSPQLLKGTQDVTTWEKKYSVILVSSRRSSGMEIGENTLADYIGKHIEFTAGSFSMASDTSVPIGVPWAHDIKVLEVKD